MFLMDVIVARSLYSMHNVMLSMSILLSQPCNFEAHAFRVYT